METKTMIKVDAPPGNYGGKFWDDEGRAEIAAIFVSHGSEFESIQFLYVDNGNYVFSDKRGDKIGAKFDTITLNYPSEFLTSLSGFRGWRSDCGTRLTSLTFGTNQGRYGPFGIANPTEDTMFDFQLGQHRYFGGFHGTLCNNGALQSIGIYVKPPRNVPTDANADTTKVKKEKY